MSTKYLNGTVSLISVTAPLTALPQVFDIWFHKNAQGVSLLSWSLFLIITIPLLIYSIINKQKIFTQMYFLWTIIYASIIIGKILYS